MNILSRIGIVLVLMVGVAVLFAMGWDNSDEQVQKPIPQKTTD